ncbi:hypothetical protein NLG97_g6367 [Lecanicillium saksenae]|uniref:Uncharacterized protein n=1 Tax=Lecanicillium saksenae TaxID=468837 RepID=A0ACC1QRP8_9HYPO|nr:hypothetical protein NLG97_g6367 [Lecanicillium saksenae]
MSPAHSRLRSLLNSVNDTDQVVAQPQPCLSPPDTTIVFNWKLRAPRLLIVMNAGTFADLMGGVGWTELGCDPWQLYVGIPD